MTAFFKCHYMNFKFFFKNLLTLKLLHNLQLCYKKWRKNFFLETRFTTYDFLKGGGSMKPRINLRKLRQDRDWTQLQAAQHLGFCRSYISAVEHGKQGLSVEMMNAIIRVFEVKYEDFYNSKINE